MAYTPIFDTVDYPSTLLIGVRAPYNKTKSFDSYFEEFCNLVKTCGIHYEDFLEVKLRSIDSAFYFTSGKLQQIKEFCEQYQIEQIVLSESISPQQERNLSDFLNCEIIDRTQLILEIFEKAAHSAEGKAQVAIAMLQHQKTRLAGKGIHLAQQSGATGVRSGPGETLKERERRHIEQLINKYKKQLEKIDRSRQTQRKRRLDSRIAQICLIGYTNAGKSTILNALTKSNVLAEDKLFATLDTTTRELYLEGQKKGLISDTVGFIQQLPHRLIEAFKSTLSELQYADLLLQVIDLSDPSWEEQIHVVHQILEELKVDKDMVYVFNKADLVSDLKPHIMKIARYQPHVVISAHSKEGILPLKEFLADWQPK